MNRKELVREAVGLINQYGSDATTPSGYSNYSRETIEAFKAHGWRYLNSGAYKMAFRKGKLVVKIGNTKYDREAYRNLRRTGLSRHVAKLYYINTVGMVQQAVKTMSNRLDEIEEQRKLRNKTLELHNKFEEVGYVMQDVSCNDGNYGTLGGALKVFDFFLRPQEREE